MPENQMFGLADGYSTPNALLQSHDPSLRDTITNAISQLIGDDRASYRRANRLMDVLELTPVGAATGAHEAGRMMGNNPIGGGAMLAGTLLPGKAGEKIAGAAIKIGNKIFTGRSHMDALYKAAEESGLEHDDALDFIDDMLAGMKNRTTDDGFITDTGRYVTRREASDMTGRGAGRLSSDELD